MHYFKLFHRLEKNVSENLEIKSKRQGYCQDGCLINSKPCKIHFRLEQHSEPDQVRTMKIYRVLTVLDCMNPIVIMLMKDTFQKPQNKFGQVFGHIAHLRKEIFGKLTI